MAVKPNRFSRNADTATSLAAFSTMESPSAPSSALNARARHGNRSVSGGSNSRRPARARSSDGRNAPHRSGYENAYWIGRRISVTPSCAITDPSISSTIEWTMDCGWTSTSMRAAETSNSQRASITSRPLFIMVAESTVILGPIFQRGWVSASAIVTVSKVSSGRRRNGPPEPVKISRRTARRFSPHRHCQMALCSLSMGKICDPWRRMRSRTNSPAMTRTSLVASAMSLPASRAASVRPLRDASRSRSGIRARCRTPGRIATGDTS